MSDAFYSVRNAFSDRRRQEDADAAARQQNMLARQAGGQMAGGDFSGGAQTLYRGGQLDAGMKVAGAGEAGRKREAEGIARFADGVQKLIDQGVDPQKAWEAGAHYAPQLGIDPAHIQRAAPLYAQDPKGFLTFARDQAQKELKVYQSGGHIRGLDTRTGKEQWAYDMPQDARTHAPQGFRPNPETGDLEIDPGYLQGKAALAKATRAPLRGRSGGRSGGPKLPSGFILD